MRDPAFSRFRVGRRGFHRLGMGFAEEKLGRAWATLEQEATAEVGSFLGSAKFATAISYSVGGPEKHRSEICFMSECYCAI